MATYKTIPTALTATSTTVYTNSGSTPAFVILADAVNTTTGPVTVSCVFVDSSNSNAETAFVNNAIVGGAMNLRLLTDRLVVEAGDSIKASASAASSINLILSIMES